MYIIVCLYDCCFLLFFFFLLTPNLEISHNKKFIQTQPIRQCVRFKERGRFIPSAYLISLTVPTLFPSPSMISMLLNCSGNNFGKRVVESVMAPQNSSAEDLISTSTSSLPIFEDDRRSKEKQVKEEKRDGFVCMKERWRPRKKNHPVYIIVHSVFGWGFKFTWDLLQRPSTPTQALFLSISGASLHTDKIF